MTDTYPPQSRVFFLHLHTDSVYSVCKVDERCKDNCVCKYAIGIDGKPRPMLVLWHDRDRSVYHVLKMQSSPNFPRYMKDMIVTVKDKKDPKKESYVDCSRPYAYSERLVCERSNKCELIRHSEWDAILDKLPQGFKSHVCYLQCKNMQQRH